MGNWHIVIAGIGPHHNHGNPADANEMAKKLVEDLKAAGHQVSNAMFVHGAVEKIGNEPAETVEKI